MASKRICSVDGCGKPAKTRGWCQAHYMRWWSNGDAQVDRPLKTVTQFGEPLRFVREVAPRYDGNDCLVWPYTKGNYGYGQVLIGGRKHLAHRLVCEAVYGSPPADKNDAAHSCGNRLCCNPRHLRWASRLENVADSRRHGTISRGERNGHAKLTEADVRHIRSLEGKLTQNDIASQYGISRQTVSKIHRRESWPWLE